MESRQVIEEVKDSLQLGGELIIPFFIEFEGTDKLELIRLIKKNKVRTLIVDWNQDGKGNGDIRHMFEDFILLTGVSEVIIDLSKDNGEGHISILAPLIEGYNAARGKRLITLKNNVLADDDFDRYDATNFLMSLDAMQPGDKVKMPFHPCFSDINDDSSYREKLEEFREEVGEILLEKKPKVVEIIWNVDAKNFESDLSFDDMYQIKLDSQKLLLVGASKEEIAETERHLALSVIAQRKEIFVENYEDAIVQLFAFLQACKVENIRIDARDQRVKANFALIKGVVDELQEEHPGKLKCQFIKEPFVHRLVKDRERSKLLRPASEGKTWSPLRNSTLFAMSAPKVALKENDHSQHAPNLRVSPPGSPIKPIVTIPNMVNMGKLR